MNFAGGIDDQTTDPLHRHSSCLVPSWQQLNSALVTLLNELRHQSGPSRLMGGASAAAVVAVEVFKEPEIAVEVFVLLHLFIVPEGWPAAVFVLPEYSDQSLGKIGGNLFQGKHVS